MAHKMKKALEDLGKMLRQKKAPFNRIREKTMDLKCCAGLGFMKRMKKKSKMAFLNECTLHLRSVIQAVPNQELEVQPLLMQSVADLLPALFPEEGSISGPAVHDIRFENSGQQLVNIDTLTSFVGALLHVPRDDLYRRSEPRVGPMPIVHIR